MKNISQKGWRMKSPFSSLLPAILTALFLLVGCAQVPIEAVQLSNTVGKDLEEVHRAHRAIAGQYFDRTEEYVNHLIDTVYGPAYITRFATDFQLDSKVTGIMTHKPENLLSVLTYFIEKSVADIEGKRAELLEPIKTQRQTVIISIDDAHRQIQAAHGVVSGHLSSVNRVHEAQNEGFKAAGLEGMREKVAKQASEISDRIAGLIKKGEKVQGKMEKLDEDLNK